MDGNRKDEANLHPQKLTWNLEMMVSNRNLLFQGSIFRFHVCFGGCTFWGPFFDVNFFRGKEFNDIWSFLKKSLQLSYELLLMATRNPAKA